MRPTAPDPLASDERQATGREKHDQKITVYLSAAELLDLEHARLALRRFGFVVDRGRLVREAIAILLADLDGRGEDSAVARRVRASLDGNGAPGSPEADGADRQSADAADHSATSAAAVDAAGAASQLLSLRWRDLRAAR